MDNSLPIDSLLDLAIKDTGSRNEYISRLEKENIANPALEIDLHHAAAVAIQRQQVLRQVKKIHQEFAEETGNKLLSKKPGKLFNMAGTRWVVRIAASVIMLFGAWVLVIYNTNSNTTAYQEIYQPYFTNTDRGIADIATHNMVEDFKNKNYQKVIQTYQILSTPNVREKFLTAYAYHEINQYTKAIELFNNILLSNEGSKSRLYNDEAEFYLALSYLKINDVKQAIPLLKKINSNPDHTYRERISNWTITKLKWLN